MNETVGSVRRFPTHSQRHNEQADEYVADGQTDDENVRCRLQFSYETNGENNNEIADDCQAAHQRADGNDEN